MSFEGGAMAAAGLTALTSAYDSLNDFAAEASISNSPSKLDGRYLPSASPPAGRAREEREEKVYDVASTRSHLLGPFFQQGNALAAKIKLRVKEMAKSLLDANTDQQGEESFVVCAQRLQLCLLWLNVEGKVVKKVEDGSVKYDYEAGLEPISIARASTEDRNKDRNKQRSKQTKRTQIEANETNKDRNKDRKKHRPKETNPQKIETHEPEQ